ncbi:zinc ribbon domain-containing protein [Evansella cellulosilytica]|uniref:zinc ribbon domain-containing protein n=1 Tax=Evansella cellulosilytica TaxID=1413 RepID=UPI0001C2805D|nr:zinc ribbon domain-containing protein [Evansella cellulosilytica]
MALRPCPECGHNVSTRAGSCPNCGFPFERLIQEQPQQGGNGLSFWGVVGAIIVAVLILSLF